MSQGHTTVTGLKLLDSHFRLLVESVDDYAIYVLDPQGIVRSWNPGAQRLKGYAPEEIVGHHFSKFHCTSDRESGVPEQALLQTKMIGRFEDVGWRVRKNGSQFWASAVLTALHDDRGALIGYAKVTRDLTERAYKAFVEATNGIVWTVDGRGRPNAESASWRAFTGQTDAQWRGPKCWDPIHPDDQASFGREWARARSEKKVFTAECRLRRNDGVYVWMTCRAVPFLMPDGSVREWFGVSFDISARRSAEEARERALNWWATTLRSIGEAVIATDRGGLVTFMNPVAEELTGWASSEAQGKSLAEVFPMFDEDTRNLVANPVDTVLSRGILAALGNHAILVRRDGSEIQVDQSASPIQQPDGALDGVVLIFRPASP